MSNPETPKDDTTPMDQTEQPMDQIEQTEQTEQLDRPDATRAIDVDDPHGTGTEDAAAKDVVAEHTSQPPATPERPSGPHAPAIVLGLVCLAVAGIVLAQELGSLSVDWGDVGPLGIVAAGAVLVLFGLIGLLSSRRVARRGSKAR